jgi:uncharacterized protein YjbJ (UPF0337 family)
MLFVSLNHRRLEEYFAMGSTADKASGLANEAIGKVKQGIGSVVGSEKLKEEGAAQELKGAAQKAVRRRESGGQRLDEQGCRRR